MKKLILVVLVSFMALNLNAQETLQIPEQVLNLYELEGTWKGKASMTMVGETSAGTVTHIWTKIADGWGMLIDEEVDIPAMGKKYIGHNILGYDIGEAKYHLYTIDNFADVHDHVGTLNGNTYYLEHNGVQPDGKSYKEEITMKIISNSEYDIDVNAIIDGQLAYTFKMNAKKIK